MTIIYKICPARAWREAEQAGTYRGSPDDIRDGFIHFSIAGQLRGTLDKHFAGQPDLVLVAVDAASLGDALRFEPSRGGELFPHLYSALPVASARAVHSLAMQADGRHTIPDLAA